jgi:hypothetical protein
MAILTYDDSELIRDARMRYWEANGFGDDGGYNKKWEIVKLGPIPIPVRNIEGRKNAIRFHDLHHLITGYDTDIPGEAQISAWELAAGCSNKWVAWILDLQGLFIGLSCPRLLLRAWARSRRSKSLYSETFDEAMLSMTVGEMRQKMQLDKPAPEPDLTDRLTLVTWFMISLVGHLAVLAAMVGIPWCLFSCVL